MSYSKPVRNYPQTDTPLGFAMPPSPPSEMANNYDAVRLNQYLPEIRALQQAQHAKYSQPASYLDNAAHLENQRYSPPREQTRRLQNGPGDFNPYIEQYRKYSAPSEHLQGIRAGQGISTPLQTHCTPNTQALEAAIPQYLQDAGQLLDHGIQAEVENVTKSLGSFLISPPYDDSANHRKHAESVGSVGTSQYAQQHVQKVMNPQAPPPQRDYKSIADGLKARLTQMHADEVVSMPRKYSSPSAWNQAASPHFMPKQNRQHLQHMQNGQGIHRTPHMQDIQNIQGAQQIQSSQPFQNQHAAQVQDFPRAHDLSYTRDDTYARDESYTPIGQVDIPPKHEGFNEAIQKPMGRRGAVDFGRNTPHAALFTPEPAQPVVPYNPSEANDSQYEGAHTSSRVWISDRCRQEEQYEVAQIGVRRNFRKYDKDIMEPIKDFGSWLEHQAAMHNVKLEAHKRKIAEMEQRALARGNENQAVVSGMPYWDTNNAQPGHGRVLGLPTIWCPDWKTPERRCAPWPTLSEMKWEGDDRARTGVKRFLPLPREPTNGAVPWNHLPLVHQQPLDQFWKIPTEYDILYPMDQIDEEAERDKHKLLLPELIDAIEPGPRDVYSKGDLDPKSYISPEPPAPPRPHFVYPHRV